MQDYLYSVLALLAMMIHLIINFDLLPGRKIVTVHGKRFRWFLAGVFAYYITDAAWGILAGLHWTDALYVDTTLYFVALAVSVLLWCRYVIAYLGIRGWMAKTISWSGIALVALHIVALAANVFNDCFFYFDGQGNYVTGPMRYVAFRFHFAFNALMAAFVLVKALGGRGTVRRRNMMVFLFCLTMTAATAIQVKWPLLPFTALGYLIGNCLLRVFVIEDERAEMRQAVIEREQAAKHMVELEKALERAQAAEKARSMFFSIVSHDIRTPLNAILGYSELLQSGLRSPAEREEALASIRASGTTLLELVNDVLDLAKMDSGKMAFQPEPVRLAQLADDVFASFHLAASGKGIELVNRTAGVPTLLLDEHRFRQILFNLVGNAVKFTAKGSVTVAASYAGTTLEVSVADTGCGIPADMLARIFDPFVQVQDPSHAADRAGGTGLGLSICRRLTETMGGELVVESELGRGSTFRIRIPGIMATGEKTATEGKPDPAAGPKPAVPPGKLPGHVLVVDDSPVNRAVLAALLKRVGIASIDHAGDGGEALAKLERAAEERHPHDFVFTDCWMPNMNGLELIGKLRADPRFHRLPVFAVTADTEYNRDERASLFTNVLLKPLDFGRLVEVFSSTEQFRE